MATDTRAKAADRAPERPVDPPEPGFWKRITPTTALGMAGALFLAGVASAFTGAVLYAFYEYRLGQTENRVDSFEAAFEEQVAGALERIDEERDSAVGQVQSQLEDLEKFAASGETLQGLLEVAAPSVWFVVTRDDAGQPSVGSAFVVFSDSEQSFLLTSYNTVRANTAQPTPGITIRKGDEELGVTLAAWDPPNDLALITVDRPSLPALTWAETDPPPQVGDRVFVVSGLGGSGGSISQGFVAGVSAEGIQHDSPVGAAFQGGPLINSAGEVLASASRTFAPVGFSPEAVFFGVPVRRACDSVMRCPDDQSQPG